MATRQKNAPTVQYCIEATIPSTGEVVDRYTIEQVETGRKSGVNDHPNYNTIQGEIHAHSMRTGLNYRVVRWGGVLDRSEWIAGGPLDYQGELAFFPDAVV